MDTEKISESWRTKEFEKYLIAKKYHHATSCLGIAAGNPVLENIKTLYGAVIDYVSSIPIKPNMKDDRKEYINTLDQVALILYGNYNEPTVQAIVKINKLTLLKSRNGSYNELILGNLPNLVNMIRDVLMKAGDFALRNGLRPLSIYEQKASGTDMIEDEEGFEYEN